jgi:N-acetylglucosamine-6-sulfatase
LSNIRVPFIVRGPGVASGAVQHAVTTHIDVAPTLLQIAGGSLERGLDGTAMPVTGDLKGTRHEHVIVEYWGIAAAEGDFGGIGLSPLGD